MRFVIVFCSAALLLLAAAAAVNYVVNPYAIYPPRWFTPVSGNDLERALRELESPTARPELVVFGSSRSSRLRPADLECYTGLTSVNAAYAGATPEGYFALASYLVENKPPPKMIIVGVDIEAFQIAAKFGDKVAGVPRLKRYLQDTNALQETWLDGTNLVSWAQLDDSLRALARVFGLDPNQTTPLERAWKNMVNALAPKQKANDQTARARAQRRQQRRAANRAEISPALVTEHYQNRFNAYTALSDEQVQYFEALLRLAREKNIAVKLFVTTLHPQLIEVLNKQGFYPKRFADVQRWLTQLQPTYGFAYYDFSTPAKFGGNTQDFFNLSHIDETNSARVIGAMFPERKAQCAP